MNRKKPSRIVEFLNGRGFYIILVLCIAAVGITGYVLFFSDKGASEARLELPPASPAVQQATQTQKNEVAEYPLTTEIPGGARRESELVMSKKPDTSESPATNLGDAAEVGGDAAIEDTRTDADAAQPSAAFYVWPLNGEVIVSFSVDNLVLSNTMNDWRYHNGMDIAASKGTHVRAIGDGNVEDIYVDEMMGPSIVVNHNNGTRSVYRSLSSEANVQIGQAVYAGDIIGAVGDSAEAEMADPSHLHLEVVTDGAHVNPLSLLP